MLYELVSSRVLVVVIVVAVVVRGAVHGDMAQDSVQLSFTGATKSELLYSSSRLAQNTEHRTQDADRI